MKEHRYLITVQHLCDQDGNPSKYEGPLEFETGNHDDIFFIVNRLRQRKDINSETVAAFGVGLKLFSQVLLENKENPLFASLKPHFSQFMQALKKKPHPA